jgi:hypothetical protein
MDGEDIGGFQIDSQGQTSEAGPWVQAGSCSCPLSLSFSLSLFLPSSPDTVLPPSLQKRTR